MTVQDGQKESVKPIKRKDLVVRFIRDATKKGEYFVRITMPNNDSKSSNLNMHDELPGGEVKWIPVLDI